MTTPAVDESLSLMGAQQGYWSNPSMGIDWYLDRSVLIVADSYERRRPASVNNPIRWDKTRAPNAFHHYWWSASPALGRIVADSEYYPGWLYLVTDNLVTPLNRSQAMTGYTSGMYERAVMNALLSLKDSKVNLGVALAEARKTAELLGSTSTRVGRQVDSFMDKNWKKLGRMNSWKKIPAAFLELSYGWIPMMLDVQGSAQALSEIFNNGNQGAYIVSKGFAKSEYQEERDIAQSTGIGRFYFLMDFTEFHQITLCYMLPTNLLSEFSSLGLTNPLEVGWELLPYSFVIDWLVPVGDWLSVLDAGAFLEFREGSYSRIQRVKMTNMQLRDVAVGFKNCQFSGRPMTMRGGTFDRSVLTSAPSASFPPLKKTLSLDKMAKGLSLLTQVFKKWA